MKFLLKYSFVAILLCSTLGTLYAQPSIYIVDQGGVLSKTNIDGTNFTILNDNIGQGNGIEIDAVGGKVYYSDGIGETIKRANLDGTGEETIVGAAGAVFGLELDLTNNRLYWIDRSENEIRFIDLSNPATINTLTTINGNFSITVIADPNNNKVYYNHAGIGNFTGEIICYDLSNNTENVILSNLRFPSGMVLFENKIYYADFGNGTINRADLDGSNIVTIETGVSSAIGLAINPTTRKIYVSQQSGLQDVYCSDVDDLMNDNIMIIDRSAANEHIALLLTSPEINLAGAGNSITDSDDCDTAPSTNNDTDFGNILVNGATNTHTFTIQNTGELSLNLTNTNSLVTIGGMHAGDFTVTQQPASSINSNGSSTFQITFDPSANGTREANVTIINNDCDEATFCYKLQGTGVDCPSFTAITPTTAVITESTCTVFGGSPTGGSISAPTSSNCPSGSTLQYSIDNNNFSASLPVYDVNNIQTIYTKCVCNITNTTTSSSSSVITSPGICQDCPDLTAITPAIAVITESICTVFGGTPTGGSISAPITNNCPSGSTLQYSIDNNNFSSSLPVYDVNNIQTIYTKCICDNTATMSSSTSQIQTLPASCGSTIPPFTADDLEVKDPCNCENPQNIILADGRYLFQDILEVKTATNLSVSLNATDNNLLDASGNAIPLNTVFTEVSTGVYELEFYTLPNIPAAVTISNGTTTEDFITDNCAVCTDQLVPTFNQWTLFIYMLLVLNLGLIGLNSIPSSRNGETVQ